jgi:hypothetical protein
MYVFLVRIHRLSLTGNILHSDTFITYPPDSALDDAGIALGQKIRQLWAAGQPGRNKTVYVNYAFGDEPLEQMYGYEPWRVQRLRAAKEKYDPDNRFGFYNPIIPLQLQTGDH